MSKLEFWILGIITCVGLYSATFLPGAGATLTISILSFFVFLVYKSIQVKTATALLLGLGYSFYLLGTLFKLMHWAFAGALLTLSLLLVFGATAFIIDIIKKAEFGTQWLSSLMVSIGILLNPIYFILLAWTTVPRHLVSNLFVSIPVIIVFPLILLLINHLDVFRKKSIYSLLLIIGAHSFVLGAIWLRRYVESIL
jgi:hypothetical protein